MTQIEEQINSKFEEILKEIRVNRNSYIRSDTENKRPGPSNLENRTLRKKYASNIPIDKDINQDDRFQPSDLSELRQPSTPFEVANENLDDTIIKNENRQEADHQMVTGPTKNILRQSFTNSNVTIILGPHPELILEHCEPPDPVSKIAVSPENYTYL